MKLTLNLGMHLTRETLTLEVYSTKETLKHDMHSTKEGIAGGIQHGRKAVGSASQARLFYYLPSHIIWPLCLVTQAN